MDGGRVGDLGRGIAVCKLAFCDSVSMELRVRVAWGDGVPSSLILSFSIWFSRVRFCVSAW